MQRGTPFTSERQPSNESKRKPKNKSIVKNQIKKILSAEDVRKGMSEFMQSSNNKERFEAYRFFGKHFTPIKQEQSGELNQNVKIIFENVGKQSEKKVE